jgi:NAD(P)-dependent dehydrogenase (short-subunit alcohol dehydrogenase family)
MRFEVSGFGVQVVVIEPGIIRSSFGETAAGSVAGDDGPYARFNAAVAEANATAADGPLGRLGGEPDDVAKVIEEAIAASRPRTRYRVTASARLLLAQRRLLPDRAWDRVIGAAFKRP